MPLKYRWQFGMRSLIAFTVIVCVAFGVVWRHIYIAQRLQANYEALDELGWDLGEEDDTGIVKLSLKPSGIADGYRPITPLDYRKAVRILAELRKISGCRFALSIRLYNAASVRVITEGNNLTALASLRIHLRVTDIDASIHELGELPNLHFLSIDSKQLTDATLLSVSRQFPNLENLSLNLEGLSLGKVNDLTDSGMHALGKLHRLKRLRLDGDGVIDDGMRFLAELVSWFNVKWKVRLTG